jgi:hypothetical protein
MKEQYYALYNQLNNNKIFNISNKKVIVVGSGNKTKLYSFTTRKYYSTTKSLRILTDCLRNGAQTLATELCCDYGHCSICLRYGLNHTYLIDTSESFSLTKNTQSRLERGYIDICDNCDAMFRNVRSYECDTRLRAHYCMRSAGSNIVAFFIPTRLYLSVVYLMEDNNEKYLEITQFCKIEMTSITSHSKAKRTELTQEYHWQQLAPYIIAAMNLPIIDDIRRYIVACVICTK